MPGRLAEIRGLRGVVSSNQAGEAESPYGNFERESAKTSATSAIAEVHFLKQNPLIRETCVPPSLTLLSGDIRVHSSRRLRREGIKTGKGQASRTM
jgi:hypothetical protein